MSESQTQRPQPQHENGDGLDAPPVGTRGASAPSSNAVPTPSPYQQAPSEACDRPSAPILAMPVATATGETSTDRRAVPVLATRSWNAPTAPLHLHCPGDVTRATPSASRLPALRAPSNGDATPSAPPNLNRGCPA